MFKFVRVAILVLSVLKMSMANDEWEIINDYNAQYKNFMSSVKWTIRNIQKSTNDLSISKIKGFVMPLNALMLENNDVTKFNFILSMDVQLLDSTTQVIYS
jgi:hypothetical protein